MQANRRINTVIPVCAGEQEDKYSNTGMCRRTGVVLRVADHVAHIWTNWKTDIQVVIMKEMKDRKKTPEDRRINKVILVCSVHHAAGVRLKWLMDRPEDRLEKNKEDWIGLAGLLYNCMRNIIIIYYNGEGKKRMRKIVEKYPETDHEQNTNVITATERKHDGMERKTGDGV